jgi:hypothetical protein
MVAIEVKSSSRFRREYRAGIRALETGFAGRVRSYIVYRGESELEFDGTRVLPVEIFLRRRWRDPRMRDSGLEVPCHSYRPTGTATTGRLAARFIATSVG